MLYYRYRPFSEFSLKELMYDELFFASAEECNDPHECWDFLQFPPDYDKWHRVLELAWKKVLDKEKAPFFEPFCDYLVKKTPVTVCEILSGSFFLPLMQNEICNSLFGRKLLINLISFLNSYLWSKKYFISFSKTPDNYLMWSHYANRHDGFCLIFKSLDGCLFQAKNGMKKQIDVKNDYGIKINVSESIAPKFKFYDVVYGNDSATIDPFGYFPKYVNDCQFADEKERMDFFKGLERHHLEKGSCWEYEQESRLLLPTPGSWITGNNVEYTKYQRLFHYDPSQLVGIIFGSRMSQENRNRIKEIVDEKIDSRLNSTSNNDRFFKFVYFQTKLSSKERKLEIEPLEINSLSHCVRSDDATFEQEYKEWEKGWCLEFNGPGSAKKVYIE